MGNLRRAGLVLLVSLALQGTVFAQQPIHWEATIDSAKTVAAQSNRLVLVFFMGGFCQPCHLMEEELRNQPGAVNALETNYVPVKINTQFYPNTAKQYSIAVLPTTVILAPTAQGDVLEVIPKRMPVNEYLSKLNQVATAARRGNAGVIAQIQPVSPAVTDANSKPRAVASPTPRIDDRTTAAIPVATTDVANPFAASTAPARSPGAAPQPIATNLANPAAPVASPPTSQRPDGVSVAMSSPLVNRPDNTREIYPPTGSAKPSNPLFGLDGFCPVQLAENLAWRPGNKKWGIIHRGRTYLFSGPDELNRFRADPDRYAPVNSGNDVVVALEQGRSVAGARDHGVRFNGRIFLFVDENSLTRFSANPQYYASRALQAMQSAKPVATVR